VNLLDLFVAFAWADLELIVLLLPEIEIKKTKVSINEKLKINKIDRPLANLTKMRREKTQISKIINAKREITKTPQKSRKSSETTLRVYILINLKILKKWTEF
jgi:hypothetical protein